MVRMINCIIVDDEPTARDILKMHIQQIESLQLVACCKNALEAFNIINEQAIDLVFLDIKMPQVSGISLAKSINNNCKVIFTTAYRDYAVEGFDLQAVDYLLKPISLERLLQSIQKYKSETTPSLIWDDLNHKDAFIFVRSDRKMVKIDFETIRYIESLSDYVKIHTTLGTVTTRETISNIELKLSSGQFFRIHRSFIVSIQHVTSYTSEYIELKQKHLPISRSYREEVIKRFEKL